MTSGTIILNALRRKWAPTAKAPAAPPPRSTAGVLDLVLPAGWPETEGVVHWRWRGPSGATEHGSVRELDEIPQTMRGVAVQLWTPARETLVTRASVPSRSAKKIAQALPYVLEDLLLDEPEKLDFAYVRETTGDLIVAVTAKARIDAWRTRLQAAGLRIARALPTYLAVPFSPGAWSACFMGGELWVRTGFMEGFSCLADLMRPPAAFERALAEARAKQTPPQQLVLYRPPESFPASSWQESLGVPVVVERKPIWDEPDSAPPGLSLLASERGTSLAALGAPLRPFLPAGVLLLLWLIGSLAFDLTEWWQLRRAHSQVATEMHGMFTRAFPEVKTILDPARQMQRELERLQRASAGSSTGDFLPLLDRLGRALGGRADVSLKTLSYREQQLTVDLLAPSGEVVDRIKQASEAGGAPTQLLSTNKRSDGVEARLRLQSADSSARRPSP